MRVTSRWYWAAIFVVLPFAFWAAIYEGALLPRLFVLQFGLAVLSARSILSTNRQQVPNTLAWLTVAWAASLLLSFTQSGNLTESLNQFSHYLTLSLIPLVAAVSLTARDLLPLFRAISLASIPIAIIGILQYLGYAVGIPSQAPPSATFFHRNAAAGYLTGVLPIAAVCLCLSQGRKDRWAYGIAAALALGLLIFTRTRGAWVGVATASIFVLILGRAYANALSVRRIVAGAAIVVAVAGLIPDRIASDRPVFDDKKESALGAIASITRAGGDRGRLGLWDKTLRMIADRPLLGVGLGNWEFQYPAYAAGDHINVTAAPRRPHNDYLWIASETGLVGLSAYLALVGFTVLMGFRGLRVEDSLDRRFILLACLFVIVAHSVDGMFNFPRERIGGASLFWLSIAGTWITAVRTGERFTYRPLPGICVAFALLCGLYLTTRRTSYDYHHLRVHTAERANDWDTVIAEGNKAVEYGSFRANTWIAMGRALYRRGQTDEAIRAYENGIEIHPNSLNAHNNAGIAYRRAGRTDEAIHSLRKAISLYPGFVEAHNNLGNALRDKGEYDASIQVLEGIRDHGPRRPQIFVNLGRSYAARGDLLKARLNFMNALRVDPSNQAARRALEQLKPKAESKGVERS